MSATDLMSIFTWWVVLFSIGLIFLPVASLFFNSFWDRGYIFAKIIGLLLVSYIAWFLSSLRILTFSTTSLFLILGLSLILNTYLSYKTKTFSKLKGGLKVILLEESLFVLGLIFWSYIKTFEPSIHGLEKFMDFGFMNSILRSEYFPPKDLWLTPLSINYYYFGHLVTAVLIKLTDLSPFISFNLMLATIFGLCLSASFSIGANLFYLFNQENKKLSVLSGFFSAFLTTLGGNLHTIYAFFQTYTPPENPTPFWQLPFQINWAGYWYPNATRFIPFTIHEFPIYSFVVSDLHGHVLNIPFVLLTIALLIQVFFSHRLNTKYYILLGLLIATSLMTNVLDGPIYLLLIFLLILFKELRHSKLFPSLLESGKTTAIITLLAVVFSLPFWLAFKPFSSGIGVLCAPDFLTSLGRIGPLLFEANHCARSPFWMLVILWGFFYLVVISFVLLVLKGALRKFKDLAGSDYLSLIFALTATVLIFIPEFVYVKDIYPAHYRANTVFKFGYQAFIFLGLISGFMITRILSQKRKALFFLVPFVFTFFLVAIYPYFAVNSYFGSLKEAKSLDGIEYLSLSYPSDYRAVLWINQNIKGQPVILEAQGDSYTDFTRVSINTGLPTVIGWPVHEWLWRGSYDESGKRITDVALLYEDSSLEVTKSLISKYKISYVFVGTLERQKYTKLNEVKFQQLGGLVFEDGQTRIYQINKF